MLSHRPTRGRTRAGARHARDASLRRRLTVAVTLVLSTVLLAPSLARADSSSTLTVVGTSDLSDSGLLSHVIGPAFEGDFPQYSFKFISANSPQSAVADAEAGGPSVLIVHDPALESGFVAGGYSDETYGRALFASDFVLAGPTTDPAAAAATGATNIAQAFADVAAAGIAGRAEFVSRGGTAVTAQEEHAIWGLVASSGLEPSGLVLCAVNATNGGGDTPIAAGAGVANGAPCPNGGALPSAKQLPSWYAATGLSQGANVLAASSCSGYPSGANACYVFTDRGTYDYLISGNDSAGTITNLRIVSQKNSATAPGGRYALLNDFHGYILNPSTPGQSVNLTAAQDFLGLITSAPVQTAIADYLEGYSGGAPYTPTASPLITTKKALPERYTASGPLTISGTVANAQPGFPAPSRVVVTLRRDSGDMSFPVASAKTNSTGAFTITTPLLTAGSYVLSTPQVTQVELPTLSPPFGDILSPAATPSSYIAVRGAISGLRATSIGRGALVTGSVGPSSGHISGKVTVYARRFGVKGAAYRKVATTDLASGDGGFATVADLPAGRWQIKTYFADPGTVLTSRGHTTTVTVAAASSRSHIAGRGVSVSHDGRLTAHVALFPKAVKGATVRLLVVDLSDGRAARPRVIGVVSPRRSTRLITVHGTLKGSGHWAVLESYRAPRFGTVWTHAVGHVTLRATPQKKQ